MATAAYSLVSPDPRDLGACSWGSAHSLCALLLIPSSPYMSAPTIELEALSFFSKSSLRKPMAGKAAEQLQEYC